MVVNATSLFSLRILTTDLGIVGVVVSELGSVESGKVGCQESGR